MFFGTTFSDSILTGTRIVHMLSDAADPVKKTPGLSGSLGPHAFAWFVFFPRNASTIVSDNRLSGETFPHEKIRDHRSALYGLLFPDIYRDVVQFWRGFCLLYLLSLVTLCSIPGMVKLHNQLSAFVANDAPAYVKQMPTLTIAKGVLTLPENRPYVITDPATNEIAMIIDTSGRYQTLEQAKARILITERQMHIQTGTEPVAVNLSQVEDMTLDQAKMYETLEILAEWAAITFFPAAVFLAYLYRVVQMIFLPVLRWYMRELSDWQSRISERASVSGRHDAHVVLFTLTGFFDVPIPLSWLIGTALTVSYIFIGIRTLQTTPTEDSSSQER